MLPPFGVFVAGPPREDLELCGVRGRQGEHGSGVVGVGLIMADEWRRFRELPILKFVLCVAGHYLGSVD